jgi:hypothetical protein
VLLFSNSVVIVQISQIILAASLHGLGYRLTVQAGRGSELDKVRVKNSQADFKIWRLPTKKFLMDI